MNYALTQEFYFEAAHTLARKIESESSRRIHGHTYHVEVTVTGEPNPDTGMIMDLALLRRSIETLRGELDHRMLDEIAELGAPTLENLARFILARLHKEYPALSGVTVARRASGDSCTVTLER